MIRGLLRGMLDGIHDGNPSSEGAIDITSGCGYGFLEALWADGVQFDITGDHWYGGDITNAGCANGGNVLAKLHAFGRPIWITEFGSGAAASSDDTAGKTAEAGYDTSLMIQWSSLATQYDIEAGFIYELLDDPATSDYYGICAADGTPEAPYTAVQSFLSTYPSVVYQQ
jgi:Glycosyl hydrolase catalytic core